MRLRSDDSEGFHTPYFLSGHRHMHNLRHKHTYRSTHTKEHCNDDERFLSYFFGRPGCPLTRSNLWRRSLCCRRWGRPCCCWAVPDQRRRGGRAEEGRERVVAVPRLLLQPRVRLRLLRLVLLLLLRLCWRQGCFVLSKPGATNRRL